MTYYTLTRAGGPWDYPTLGFTAVNGAVLNGAASAPAITSPPDAYWAVGGSSESGITRYGNPTGGSSPAEPAEGAALVYNATTNQYEPMSASLTATYAARAGTVRSPGDNLTGHRELRHEGTSGYIDHLIAGTGSGGYLVGLGVDLGDAGGILVAAKNTGTALALQLVPSHTGYGLQLNGYNTTKAALRFEQYVGTPALEFVQQTGKGFADGVATNGSTTFTSATAAFAAGDVGVALTQLTSRGEGFVIPAATTIVSVTNSTTVVLSAAATGSATGINFFVAGRVNSTSQAAMTFYRSSDGAPYLTIRPTSTQYLNGSSVELFAAGSNPAKQLQNAGETRFYQYNATDSDYYATYMIASGATWRIRMYDHAAQGSESVYTDAIRLQKDLLGFFGATGSNRRATTPDATDLATAITLANALKADLVAFGLKS